MLNSQQSFGTLYGRFQNGDALVQSILTYDPKNVLIKKASLTIFIEDVATKDKAANLSLEDWKEAVGIRKPLAFRIKNCDENCLENRIRNIHAYIGAEIGKNTAAYKMVGNIIKKINPKYEKKDPALPKGSGRSPSEKSFVALNGYAKQVLDIITELGVDYAPQNVNIQVTDFGLFVADMSDKAKNIAKLISDYSNSCRIRLDVYNNSEGLLERQRLIKDYLASFSGGKKSQNWVEYDRLIKGRA